MSLLNGSEITTPECILPAASALPNSIIYSPSAEKCEQKLAEIIRLIYRGPAPLLIEDSMPSSEFPVYYYKCPGFYVLDAMDMGYKAKAILNYFIDMLGSSNHILSFQSKIVIVKNIQNINRETQLMLRNFCDEYSGAIKFIFTTTDMFILDDSLISRCGIILAGPGVIERSDLIPEIMASLKSKRHAPLHRMKAVRDAIYFQLNLYISAQNFIERFMEVALKETDSMSPVVASEKKAQLLELHRDVIQGMNNKYRDFYHIEYFVLSCITILDV